MPFLAICPDCRYAQVCVLPASIFPKVKCCRCRTVYDPVGTADTEIVLELAGATRARIILEHRARRARDFAARRTRRSKPQARPRKRALAGAGVGNGVDSESAAAALLELPVGDPTGPIAPPEWVPETSPVSQVPTAAATVPRPVPARRLPRPRRRSSEDSDTAVICGWLAVTLAGASLTASQFPFGWWIGLGLVSIGFVLALKAVRHLRSRLTALSTVVSGASLLVLVALPSWLGIQPFERGVKDTGPERALAVGKDGSVNPLGAGWVDVLTSSWQFDDVRVITTAPALSSAWLVDAHGQVSESPAKYLAVRVHLRNEGGKRDIPVPDFGAGNIDPPRLTDAAGNAIGLAEFSTGARPARPRARAVGPGQAVDFFLYFTAPAAPSNDYRLELPGRAFGVAENVRLRLPGLPPAGRK